MEEVDVLKMIDDAIKSLEKGEWTLPSAAIAFLTALKYIIECEGKE